MGMTQEELAKKLGYANRSSVNKVETSRELSNKKVKLFADALNTTPAYLMGWDDVEWNPKTQEISVDDHAMDKKYNQLIDRMKSNKDFEEIIFEYADMMYKRFEKE